MRIKYGGGGIASVSVDESYEEQGKNEEGGFISSKTFTTIYLTVTSSYDPMSVDNTDDNLFVIRSPIETDKLSSQPATSDLSYSSSTPITVSESALSLSSEVPSSLKSFSTSSNNT